MRGVGFAALAATMVAPILFSAAAQAQVLIAGMADGKDAVTPDAIRKIEQTVTLPDGAGTVADYARYYAPGDLAGRKLIAGVYVRKAKLSEARIIDGAKPVDGLDGVFLTSYGKLPRMPAGGCDMVTTYYDTGLQRFFMLQEAGRDAAEARCNAAR
ncbi:MAG: hypothetical protein K1X51_13645 [Rhodospirillaceae bacterium]|nr:hypothetical protein [Rhodospirillaceae bacterium]